MTFFSFEVAPVVFRTIDRAIAGQAVAAVIPRYYRLGAGAERDRPRRLGRPGDLGQRRTSTSLVGTALCALMVAMLLLASAVLVPRAETARRARDDAVFARAHRASIQVNLVTLGAGAAFLAARRPQPAAGTWPMSCSNARTRSATADGGS